MKIVTDILIAMFIVFIMLPFVLLCSLIIIYEMVEIFGVLKGNFQELLNEREKR